MDSPEDGDAAVEHPDMAGSAQQVPIWPKVATDYHGALVRLATMRAAGKQYLLFGYVELFPRDIPVPERFTAGETAMGGSQCRRRCDACGIGAADVHCRCAHLV